MTSLFHAYDLRGVYKTEFTTEDAKRIGMAFGRYVDSKTVIVGRDARTSSPVLRNELIGGIQEVGINVVDIGVVTTPMFYFSTVILKLPGVMVTASHNPKEYNGFKFSKADAIPMIYQTDLVKIEKLMETKYLKTKKGTVTKQSILSKYCKHIISKARITKKFKIVVDCSNGVGGIPAKIVLDSMKIKYTPMYFKPDGNFPNHSPNPMENKSLEHLIKKVKSGTFDFGVIFDGDADRIVFVDHTGEIIPSDYLLAVIAGFELKTQPFQRIYVDLRSSRSVSEYIKVRSGQPVLLRVGNAFDKFHLMDEGGILGGELSGHIMFSENYNIDDPLFCLLKIMTYLSTTEETLRDLIRPLKKYNITPEINIKVKDKDQFLARIKTKFSKNKQKYIDGVTVEDDDWWFNARKSNTEPLIRLRIEANEKDQIKKIRKQIESLA